LGYIFREVGENNSRHYFLLCDNCGFEVDIFIAHCALEYKEKYGWITLFNNFYVTHDESWKVRELCNSCAKTLGYIKDKKETVNECQKI
jgi:hypothetical protein